MHTSTLTRMFFSISVRLKSNRKKEVSEIEFNRNLQKKYNRDISVGLSGNEFCSGGDEP